MPKKTQTPKLVPGTVLKVKAAWGVDVEVAPGRWHVLGPEEVVVILAGDTPWTPTYHEQPGSTVVLLADGRVGWMSTQVLKVDCCVVV